jgi:hypothetical protein
MTGGSIFFGLFPAMTAKSFWLGPFLYRSRFGSGAVRDPIASDKSL